MKSRIILIFLIFVLISITGLLSIPVYTLEISEPNNKKLIFRKIVKPDSLFETSFIHSLELSPVREFFKINSNYQIILYKTEYYSQGAGLPSTLNKGEMFKAEGEKFVISDINRLIDSIDFRVVKNANHTFRFTNNGYEKFINLSDSLGDSLVRIKITKYNLLTFLVENVNG